MSDAIKIFLCRGTQAQCSDLRKDYKPKHGLPLGLVTDAPELRFFDGVTQGGVSIPLPTTAWEALLNYHNLETKNEQPT
jgi:hypothetical protein